jgi:hypothetical protein
MEQYGTAGRNEGDTIWERQKQKQQGKQMLQRQQM